MNGSLGPSDFGIMVDQLSGTAVVLSLCTAISSFDRNGLQIFIALFYLLC